MSYRDSFGGGGINSRDLDNYITGHWGEDQFRNQCPKCEGSGEGEEGGKCDVCNGTGEYFDDSPDEA